MVKRCKTFSFTPEGIALLEPARRKLGSRSWSEAIEESLRLVVEGG